MYKLIAHSEIPLRTVINFGPIINMRFPNASEYLRAAATVHLTMGIRWWSPTQLLIHRSEA